MRVKTLSADWNDPYYLTQDFQKIEMNLDVTSLTLSGFGSGAQIASDIFAIFNHNIDGLALFSGGGPSILPGDYSGMANKPVYVYSGSLNPDFESIK